MSVTVFDYDFADPIHPLSKFLTRRKNCGWILKKAKSIESFEVHIYPENISDAAFSLQGTLNIKSVKLPNINRYSFLVKFADIFVLLKFLKRPLFKGIPITIYLINRSLVGTADSIGSSDNLDIIRKELSTQKTS